ncbi:hypothetical protein AMJ80_09995 [bacterium SM23_31]|nr:MAG: hypothetical protein AMJ80_09995 [bacterium SM23_31]
MDNKKVIIILLLLLFTSICFGQESKTYTVEVIDGVRHVHNEKPLWGDEPRIELELITKIEGRVNNYFDYDEDRLPCDFTVDGDGNIYILDRFKQNIQKFGSDGSYNADIDSSGFTPGGKYWKYIEFDASGNMYICSSIASPSPTYEIDIFSSEGRLIQTFPLTPDDDISDFRVLSSGEIVVGFENIRAPLTYNTLYYSSLSDSRHISFRNSDSTITILEGNAIWCQIFGGYATGSCLVISSGGRSDTLRENVNISIISRFRDLDTDRFMQSEYLFLDVYDNNGKSVRKIAHTYDSPFLRFDPSQHNTSVLAMDIVFSTDTFDNIYIAAPNQKLVEKFNADGELELRFYYDVNNNPANMLTIVNKEAILFRGSLSGPIDWGEEINVYNSLDIDPKGRIWLLTIIKEEPFDEYVAKKVDTDIYALSIHDPEGVLVGNLPLSHYATSIKIHDDRLYVFDPIRAVCLYIYKIVEK